MKYGQIIKPEDVPCLVRSGELRFGMGVECQISVLWVKCNFIGCDIGSEYPWCCKKGDGSIVWFRDIRFPLPDLKNGDPVVCGSHLHRVFAGFKNDGIMVYPIGLSSWTHKYTDTFAVGRWRLPTKKELHDAGLDGWYDGRIELNEE